MRFISTVALTFLLFAAGLFAQTAVIDHITPDHLPAGSPNTTITVVGQNFGGLRVFWDSTALTTTQISSRILTATIPSALLDAIGTHTVTVGFIVPDDRGKNVFGFRVLTPLAVVDSYSPTNFVAGQYTPVVVIGQEFPSNATIIFDWQAITTTFVSSTQLQGTVPGSIIGANTPHHIAVYDGAFPGGSVTFLQPQQFNLGTISVSVPILNFQNGVVIRDTQGTVTLGTPWFSITDLVNFSMSSGGCDDGLVLLPGNTCLFTINCNPVSPGLKTATLTIFSDALNGPQTSSLSCTGSSTNTIQVVPSSLSFGSTATGAPVSLSFNVSASFGAFSLLTPYKTLTGSGDFTVTGGTCVDAGAVPCTVTATFTPSSAGNKTASLAINSGADNNPVAVALSGTGVSAVGHTVGLSWGASPSTNVLGYNVYRAIVGNSFPGTPLNGGTPVNALTYTDSTVSAGTTYVYGLTAVGGSPSWPAGTQSSMVVSNQVTP